jgi:hypothetical protein
MVMQGKLDPALKDSIRSAFLELKDAVILKTFRAEGFAATDDKAYDVLRETAKILNLDLSKMSSACPGKWNRFSEKDMRQSTNLERMKSRIRMR